MVIRDRISSVSTALIKLHQNPENTKLGMLQILCIRICRQFHVQLIYIMQLINWDSFLSWSTSMEHLQVSDQQFRIF